MNPQPNNIRHVDQAESENFAVAGISKVLS